MGYKENIASEFLKEGKTFKLSSTIRIGNCNDRGTVYVLGLFSYPELKFLTKNISKNELKYLKENFNNKLETSSNLKEYLKDKSIEFRLAYDYGMGSIGICKEVDNEILWEYSFDK